MVFAKVLAISVRILFFLILLGGSLAFVQDKRIISKTKQAVNEDDSTSSPETVKNLSEELETKSKKAVTEKNPFVFRRQQFNESTEKVQLTDNGTLMKSSYIPIMQNHWSFSPDDSTETGADPASEKNKSFSVSAREPEPSTEPIKEDFLIKNGKKYRIIKIKKTLKSTRDDQLKMQMQRRTLKPLPRLLSILPLKWMTRQREGTREEAYEAGSESNSPWSGPVSVRRPEENSKISLGNNARAGEKVKKLLNLFTIVQFGNEGCHADGVEGTCLHRVECEANGGKFAAGCAGDLGVCCYIEKTCGSTTNANFTYFINEGFPETSTAAPKICTLTLEKANPHVKQLRLDFQTFQLREPTNGTCLHDRFAVSGHDTNEVVPEICGGNTGQHMYVGVEDSRGPFILNVITTGEYFPRNFRIKVTQLNKEDELLAPKNCLQYYTEPIGYVQTFNYQEYINDNLDQVVNGYFNNLNYAICIKKVKEFCSISYENEERESTQPTFQMVNVDEDGERLLPPRQAGAETFDCPDDYIIINGIRLCGEKLNDASSDVDYTRNHPVLDTTNGPYVLSVRTDAAVSGRGFNLKYRQHPCPT